MLKFGIDAARADRLIAIVGESPKQLKRELKTAVNATARTTRSRMNKTIRESFKVSIKAINKVLKITSVATEEKLSASVEVKKETDGNKGRIPLKEFGARQTKKGVTYKIKHTGGRQLIKGAFQGPKPDQRKISWQNNVFKRVGKARLPIVKLYGPSVWGVFVIGRHVIPTQNRAKVELNKQVDRRIRFLELKLAGKLRGNQK